LKVEVTVNEALCLASLLLYVVLLCFYDVYSDSMNSMLYVEVDSSAMATCCWSLHWV